MKQVFLERETNESWDLCKKAVARKMAKETTADLCIHIICNK